MAHIKKKLSAESKWIHVVRDRPFNGKERSKSFKTKQFANAFMHQIDVSKYQGRFVDPGARSMTVGEFAPIWLSSRLNLGTARATFMRCSCGSTLFH